jgi:hypothetical protein
VFAFPAEQTPIESPAMSRDHVETSKLLAFRDKPKSPPLSIVSGLYQSNPLWLTLRREYS